MSRAAYPPKAPRIPTRPDVLKSPLFWLRAHTLWATLYHEGVAGAAFKVEVAPGEGYGDRNEQMVITLPRTQGNLPADIAVGFVVELVSPEGDEIPARVVKLTETDITLDANHPLAGETLYFDIELTDVRAATKEEIEHGHAHGPGGHHHH